MAITAKFDTSYDNGAIIGYENLLTSAPTENASKALTPNTYERWATGAGASTVRFGLSSNADVNFVGIAAHNLSGETVTIQYAATVAGGLTTIDIITVASNEPIFITFDPINVREIAIVATYSATKEVGAIYAGSYLQMPIPIYGGHDPITLSPKTEYQNNMSESGQFLGRNIVRQGVESNYSFRYLDPDFVRGAFSDFISSARLKPFFIQWRPDLYPDEVAFGYTPNDVDVNNSGGGNRLMTASFSVKGHRDI